MQNTAQFLYAAKRGITNTIIQLAHRVDINDIYTYNNDTPLIWASRNGHLNTVKLLLEYGSDIHVVNNQDMDALMWASQNEHIDIVKILIENSADNRYNDIISIPYTITNIRHCKRRRRREPLEYYYEAVITFTQTPLLLSIQYDHTNIFNLLRNKNINVNTQNRIGYTLLHLAATYGSLEISQLLLQEGANINCKTIYEKKDTPITLICGEQPIKQIEFFVHHGGNPNDLLKIRDFRDRFDKKIRLKISQLCYIFNNK